jgi:hypothetical protein
MTKNRESSQAAFPCNFDDAIWQVGLTKREYFAGLAMQSLIISNNPERHPYADEIATAAVP